MKTDRLSREMEKDEFKEQGEQLVEKYSFESDLGNKEQKSILPEIVAAVIVMSNLIVIGKSFGYSAILVPQLLEYKNITAYTNSTDDMSTTMVVSESDTSWIVSVLSLVVVATSPLSGIVLDSLGRLNAIKLSAIPNIIGWILIATAKNVTLLIIGRVLTGAAVVLVISSTTVYVTEVSSPGLRGALVALSPCLFSLGIMLAYLEGWFLAWQTVAWISVIFIIVPVALVILWVPESPTWLVSKNRIDQAKTSLERLNKYKLFDTKHEHEYIERQISLLLKDSNGKEEQIDANGNQFRRNLRMFSYPEVYRPFLLFIILFFIQQFSGLFIVLFYAVSVFMEIGININAYLAAVIIGFARFGMSIIAIFLMKRYRKRPLLIVSSLGMGISIGLSGVFTVLIKKGYTGITWIPVIMIFLYVVCSMIGMLTISWTIVSELFPTDVRGIASNLSLGVLYLLMFVILQQYFTLLELFGGIVGLQYFFAVISFSGALYGYFLLPETHNKELSEIQEYFRLNWTNISIRTKTSDSKIKSEEEHLSA